MCGIHGAINASVEHSLYTIEHRGPDYQHYIEFKENGNLISLGHTRLSIVDLSPAGNQPMVTEDGNHAIIFNGEIYNHQELRLKLSNTKFRGHSDTETILNYIKEFGIDNVNDFNGIFAFSYFNRKSNKLYLARDPFGVKPLYYYIDGSKAIFSSEIRSFHALGVQKELSIDLLATFLRLRYLPSPFTLYNGIKKVRPGELICIDLNKQLKFENTLFADVPKINHDISKREALVVYEEKLSKAVARQLMADVPISFLLSGGVDSALLAKIIKNDCEYNIGCYTAGYNIESKIDEISDATETARILGLNQKHIILSEEDFIKKLPDLINIVEEPLGSQSVFPIFYLTQSIKNDGYKVAMSGQGIDEPMGGYRKYRAQNLIQFFGGLPLSTNLANIFSHVKNDDVRRAIKAVKANSLIEQIKASTSFFDEDMLNRIFLNPNIANKDISENIISERIKDFDLEDRNVTETMMNLDARMNLSDDLLLYTDKIAMHNSIELRVPYLDIELVKFLETLPSSYKVNTHNNKILHKKLAKQMLPKGVVARKKKGFYTPRKIWFKGNTGEYFINEIKNDNSLFSSIFNKSFILELFDMHKTSKVNYEKQLYLIIVLFIWMKQNFK